MKIRISLFLLFSISVLIISTQGVLTFNIFKPLGVWQLKTFLQPLALFQVFFYFLFLRKDRKVRINATDILLFGYFLLTVPFLFYNVSGGKSAYIAIREVYLLYIAIFVFKQLRLPPNYYDKILKLIYYLVLLNIFFAVLVYFIGIERYMVLLTGDFFWGTHDEYKFKISNFMGTKLYRVPALLGESASVGFFGVISFFLLKNHPKYRYKAYYALLLMALSFTRSVYLIAILYFVSLGISSNEKIRKFLVYALFTVPIIIGLMIWKNLFDVQSLIIRLQLWQEKVAIESNWLFGGNIGKLGGALVQQNAGFLSVVDNYWIFTYFSIGWVGIILILLFFYEQTFGKRELKIIIMSILIAGLVVTLTQSMVILVFIPLLFMQNNLDLMKDGTTNKRN